MQDYFPMNDEISPWPWPMGDIALSTAVFKSVFKPNFKWPRF